MEVIRGARPETISRPISVQIPRDEVMACLVGLAQRHMGPNAVVRFDGIEAVGDPSMKLQTITLHGVETIRLKWGEKTPVEEEPVK